MKKQGMAIPMVIVLAAILGLLSTFVVKGIKQYNQSNQTSHAQLQAYFIARAGVEHAMLKTKLLHRELYDAICLSQGRNPLFDYSQVKQSNIKDSIKSYNPGPIFLYKRGVHSNQGLFTDNFIARQANATSWLDSYKSDLASNYKVTNINKILDINDLDKDVKNKMGFQFAEYKVSDLNIAAQQTNENDSSSIENSVIIEMTIGSEILTTRADANKKTTNHKYEESWNYQIKKTIKISRD